MKIFQGIVTSTKMAKTLTVEVERFLAHPVYKKRYKRSKKYQVHSDQEHKLGDVVRFVETAPISKTKKWIVLEEAKKKVAEKVSSEKSKVATKVAKSEKKGKK